MTVIHRSAMGSLQVLAVLVAVAVFASAIPRSKRDLAIGKALLPAEVQDFLQKLSAEEKTLLKELKEHVKETVKSGKKISIDDIEGIVKSKSPELHEKLQKLKAAVEAKISKLPEGAQKFLKEVKANVLSILTSGQTVTKEGIKEQIGKIIAGFKALSEEDKNAIFTAFPNLKKLAEEPQFKHLIADPSAAADIAAADLEVN